MSEPSFLSQVQQLPDLVQLTRSSPIAFKRPHGKFQSRAAKGSLGQVADELALRGFPRHGRFVDVDAVLLATGEQPLIRHDLHELQYGGVARWFTDGELFVDLA